MRVVNCIEIAVLWTFERKYIIEIFLQNSIAIKLQYTQAVTVYLAIRLSVAPSFPRHWNKYRKNEWRRVRTGSNGWNEQRYMYTRLYK